MSGPFLNRGTDSYHPEIDDDELYERMKAKLLSDGGRRPAGLDEEERRMAVKLMGLGQARQIDRARREGGRVRYRRPVVKVEYWCHRAAWGGVELWNIDVVEDGVRRNLKSGLYEDECNFVVRAISRKGIPVTKVMTEYMKQREVEIRQEKQRKPISRRKAILDQMKDIRI